MLLLLLLCTANSGGRIWTLLPLGFDLVLPGIAYLRPLRRVRVLPAAAHVGLLLLRTRRARLLSFDIEVLVVVVLL